MPHDTPFDALPPPALQFFADVSVAVDAPLEVGAAQYGRRRVIPIVGGDVVGDGWRARVLPGGADFQLLLGERVAELDARYVLETDAGDRIYVHNQALRSGAADDMARLARGEPVAPGQIYFRCCPRFETASPALGWITERLFVGTGVRRPDRVLMRFFAVL